MTETAGLAQVFLLHRKRAEVLMRKALAILTICIIVPATAVALSTKDLLATIALPLAVAAVSNVANVPQDQLVNLVTSLNQANVPAVQAVQVIRYVPVVTVDQNGQPFVAYVQQQTSQGITGDALANAIAQRLQSSYGVTPQYAVDVTPTYVLSDNYIPTIDPLAAIGLPLAVAAVSNISGVPQDQLASLVASLNQANVPVVQEIHVIRYVPVALIDNGTPFVQFVQTQVTQGVTGPALVPVITQQLQTYYPAQVVVNTPPQRIVVEETEVPPVVVTRFKEARAHPHGGPPGQIKKELGLQTGAEVVHGTPPAREEHGRGEGHEKQQQQVPMASSAPPVVVAPPGQQKEKEHGKAKGHGKD